MAKKSEVERYTAILLEDVNAKFSAVLEAHHALRSDLGALRDELHETRDTINGNMIALRDTLRAEMAAGYDKLDRKIDGVRDELTQKIDGVRSDLTQKIEGVRDELNRKIDGVRDGHGAKIDSLSAGQRRQEQKIDAVRAEARQNHAEVISRLDTLAADFAAHVADPNAHLASRYELRDAPRPWPPRPAESSGPGAEGKT